MKTLPSINEMRKAFYAQDPTYDGLFFTGVRTTGIFCRPSCTARKPLPKNIEFFSGIREALFSGYRACKRCDPLNVQGSPPSWVAKLLNRVEENPASRIKDSDLEAEGIDPIKARRYFLKNYGLTFQAYCRSRRMGQAFTQIRDGAKLDDAVFESGYESHSGFREAFVKAFGTPPGKGRFERCITIAWLESPLGPLIAGATDQGVCLLEFTERRMMAAQIRTLQKRLRAAMLPGKHRYLAQLQKELTEYFDGTRKDFEVPLEAPGTPFQELTWKALRQIPFGKTISYEALAKSVGDKNAQRAVARANGMNRIAIVIPCHRVINKSGELGGYGGGIWRKQFLLDLERSTHQQTQLHFFSKQKGPPAWVSP